MPHCFVLGNPERSEVQEGLREGLLQYSSRRGLAVSQRILVEKLPKKVKGRVLTGLDSEGAVAMAAMALYGPEQVDWVHHDVYLTEKVKLGLTQNGLPESAVKLSADLPGSPGPGSHGFLPEGYGLVALGLPKGGEAALARELIEQAHAVLRPGGVLLVGSNNENGMWLYQMLRATFGDASRVALRSLHGCLVSARRRKPLAKLKDHSHKSRVSLREQIFSITTRPGVFGHRRVDQGTRALVEKARVAPGQLLVDIGCGPGTIGLVLGKETGAPVVLVDSSLRATEMAALNAAANGVDAQVITASDLYDCTPDFADHVFCNPPYYSNFRIAESFFLSARRVLQPGGKIWVVAKNADAHGALLAEMFADVTGEEHRGYGILTGFRPLEPAEPVEPAE